MKICLVLPHNRRRISPQPYYRENLGIQYIAAYLRLKGNDCSVINADGNCLTEKQTVSVIASDSPPSLVGFSLSVDTADSVFSMCEELRRTCPSTLICLGGQHATYFAREILAGEPSIDFIVLGEGEETMEAVCEGIAHGSGVPRLSRGLAYRMNGEVVITEPSLLQKDLDQYPNPDRTQLSELSERGEYAMPMILTSRGCPYRCSFCSSHDFFGGRWRTRDPSAVVSEIENICENFNCSHFYFVDDQILGRGVRDKRHLLAIVDDILKRELHRRYDLYFFVMMRADFYQVLSVDELVRFRLAGFKDIFIGFESGSDQELTLFTKGFKSSDYHGTLLLRREFFIEGGFILFHPYTSQKTLADDAGLIRALGLPNWSYYSKRLVPYPGSKLFLRMKAEGKLTECNYRGIRYELANSTIQDIYDAVTAIENEIGVLDDEIFAVIDEFEKLRLRRPWQLPESQYKFEAQTSKLSASLQELAELYYESFLALSMEPRSVSLKNKIVGRFLGQIKCVQREYRLSLHGGSSPGE